MAQQLKRFDIIGKYNDEDTRYEFRPDGDCYDADEVDAVLAEKDAAIEELKQKLEDVNELIKTARKMLEDAKATHYAEMVDADMENRKLKRALWLARAERAKEKQQLFHFSLDFEKLCIDGFYDPYSSRRELSPKQWIKAFNKVEVKLLKKAEEYQ